MWTRQPSSHSWTDPIATTLFFDASSRTPPAMVTSALVVAEGHGWFLRRYDSRRAIQFLVFLDALPRLTIQAFDANELAKSARLVKRFSGQNLTLADAHGLAIMAERHPVSCWSTDRHLGLTGVPLAV